MISYLFVSMVKKREYHQEVPQSQITYQSIATWGSDTRERTTKVKLTQRPEWSSTYLFRRVSSRSWLLGSVTRHWVPTGHTVYWWLIFIGAGLSRVVVSWARGLNWDKEYKCQHADNISWLLHILHVFFYYWPLVCLSLVYCVLHLGQYQTKKTQMIWCQASNHGLHSLLSNEPYSANEIVFKC